MRILIEEKVQKNGELSRENRTVRAKKSRKRNKKSNMPSLVQKLFQTCKEVFASCEAGTVPPPEDVERLRVVLDSMKPEDVGLTVDMPFFRTMDAEGSPPITYLHIYECNKFSMGIFCLPPSGVIPLHNHPGMTVFSKLLFGSMHIKSYDWVDMPRTDIDKVDPSYVQPAGVRLAKVKVDSVFTAPCNTSILYPADGGNMHCFTAVTSCAVLDVLGPPYSDPEGRHCTYYRDIPYKKISGFTSSNEIYQEERREEGSCDHKQGRCMTIQLGHIQVDFVCMPIYRTSSISSSMDNMVENVPSKRGIPMVNLYTDIIDG